MALRMSSEAREGSAISPLRTPRERDWPTPMMLRTPSGLTSPTTAQIFEVPISRPTIMEEGSDISFLVSRGFNEFLNGHGDKARLEPARRQIVGDREIDRGQMLADELAVIIDQPPATELAPDIVESKDDFAVLAGRDLQNARSAQIDSCEFDQPCHGRTIQRLDQAQGGMDLR